MKKLPVDVDEAVRPSDGRNIDPELGSLSGEGALQQVLTAELEGPHPTGAPLPALAARAGPGGQPTYYGQAVLKEPLWLPTIPIYFQLGATAGAAAVLGAAAELSGRPELRRLGRQCHWIALVGEGVGAAILIHDLGRTERFLNMLRVFRPTSPMSIGAWVLSASSAAHLPAVLLSGRPGRLGALGRASGLAGGLLGIPLAGYSAVLLSNTAVPLWQRIRRPLPLIFMASGMAGAAAVLELLPQSPAARRAVRSFGIVGRAAELGAGLLVESSAGRSAQVARPLHQGLTGTLWRAARVATAASLVLSLLPPRPLTQVTSSLLGTAGSLAMRFALLYGGKASARDPKATFRSQLQGFGAAELGTISGLEERPAAFRLPEVR